MTFHMYTREIRSLLSIKGGALGLGIVFSCFCLVNMIYFYFAVKYSYE